MRRRSPSTRQSPAASPKVVAHGGASAMTAGSSALATATSPGRWEAHTLALDAR